jgi:hypothetical protein
MDDFFAEKIIHTQNFYTHGFSGQEERTPFSGALHNID